MKINTIQPERTSAPASYLGRDMSACAAWITHSFFSLIAPGEIHKKLASALVAFALIIGLSPGGFIPARAACESETCPLEGSGTEGAPYLINTAQQFNHLREHVTTADNFDFDQISNLDIFEIAKLIALYNQILAPTTYYKLMDDIDLSEYSGGSGWTPIGGETSAFFGMLMGNNKKITGLRINNRSSEYQGLFGTFAGIIQGLTIEECSVIGGTPTGAIAGRMAGMMENCHVSGGVFGSQSTGGLVGDLAGIVSKCSNAAKVSAVGNAQNIGGIAGRVLSPDFPAGTPNPGDALKGKIQQCINSGDISNTTAGSPNDTAGSRVGGIAGVAEKSLSIDDCFNTGNIKATGHYAGGIVGYAWHSQVKNCYSTGTVEGGAKAVGALREPEGFLIPACRTL